MKDKNIGFEKKLERLEEISTIMENDDTPIDKSMALFQEGIKIASELQKELDKMERRIEILMNSPNEESGDNQEEEDSDEDIDNEDNDEKPESAKKIAKKEEPRLELFPELD